MNWLGDSFPVAMNRLPLILAVVFFALYVVMLWLLLFRRPSFRTLSGRDRWSVVTATFGVMAVWMLLSCLLIRAVPFFGGRRGLRLAFPIAVMSLMIWTIVTTWPVAVWTAFRIALRRLAKKERRILISWLSVRVSAAFLLAFSLVWLVFHFVFAGRRSTTLPSSDHGISAPWLTGQQNWRYGTERSSIRIPNTGPVSRSARDAGFAGWSRFSGGHQRRTFMRGT